MAVLAYVLVEYKIKALNKPFLYAIKSGQDVGVGKRVKVIFNNRLIIGFVIEILSLESTLKEYEEKTSIKYSFIEEVIDDEPLLNDELMELAKKISSHYFSPLISVLNTMLPPSLKPSSSFAKKPKIAYETYLKVISDDEKDLTPKQIEYLRLIKQDSLTLKSALKKKNLIAELIKKHKIVEEYIEKLRIDDDVSSFDTAKELSQEQRVAYESILAGKEQVYLIHGVTGSGKTELYLQLSEKLLQNGESIIILVPEINLTASMVKLFKSRFCNNVAVLHSGLSDAKKYDEYRRIARGDVRIVVGARSAIFAPVKNLGMIIIDEEHVESYKQETSPYYHTRTVAIMRVAARENAKVILGSATPTLETMARAKRGVYRLIELKNRINCHELPTTSIVDLNDLKNIDTKSVIISIPLREAIQERIDKNEQVMLLLNRRGYSSVYRCKKCGKVFKCPNCDIPLTYHQEDNSLKCHHCDFLTFDLTCQYCQSNEFVRVGYGTERIEEELNKLFPQARVVRLDGDVAMKKTNMFNILNGFKNQEYDILIGTQMIAKGHDFQNVTLSAIILCDISLTIPSYRSGEATFDLISQLVGRSGRGEKAGIAIIQSYVPETPIITLGAKQDYHEFFDYEMAVRKATKNPPYVYLITLTISSESLNLLKEMSFNIKSYLVAQFKNKAVDILGPTIPFLKKINNRNYRKIMIKYKNREDIELTLQQIDEVLGKKSEVRIDIDVDPVSDY